MAEGARTKLRGAMEPADDLSGPQQLDSGVEYSIRRAMQRVAAFHIVEDLLDFCSREGGPPIHRPDFRVARLAHLLMPNPDSRTHCGAGVAGSGWNENIPHSNLALQRSHKSRVVKYATSEADPLESSFPLQGCKQVRDQLRDGSLHAAGDI